jgi:hypothetical protein
MHQTSDFTDSEMWTIHTTLAERYTEAVETQLGDAELRLHPYSSELTTCPVVYWERGGCHFVVFKTGDHGYRCQFYYRVHEIFGTGIEEFDDLAECMVILLQVQADHAARLAGH